MAEAARRSPRARSVGEQVGVGEQGADDGGDVARVLGVEEGGRAGRDLRQGGRPRTGDGRAAGHGLEHRQAEALVERREDEEARAGVQRRQIGVGDEAGEDDAVADARRDGPRGRAVAAPAEAAGHDQAMAGVGAFPGQQRPGLDEPGEVLARLEVAEGEHVGPADAEAAEEGVGVRRARGLAVRRPRSAGPRPRA